MGVLKLTGLEAGVLTPAELEAVTLAVYCVAAVSPATWQLDAWQVVVTAVPPSMGTTVNVKLAQSEVPHLLSGMAAA